MPGQPFASSVSSNSLSSLEMPPSLNAHNSGNSLSNSFYALQSPTLTFASSSSSSLPMQSSSSLSSAEMETELKPPSKPTKHKKVKSLANLFRRKKHQEVVLEPSFHNTEDLVFHSSSYVSTDIIDHTLNLPEPEALIDLDAALNPFKVPAHRRTESAPEASIRRMPKHHDETILEEEEDTVVMGQQAASMSTISLASTASSNRDRARLARNFNSLTLGPLLDTSGTIPTEKSEDPLAHVKAMHRLSSTTNETITPSVSHRPNSGIFDSPGTVRAVSYQAETESICSEVSDLGEPSPEPATQDAPSSPSPMPLPTPQTKQGKFRTHHAAARFSISSLASFATFSASPSNGKRRSRVWSWMKGKRVSASD